MWNTIRERNQVKCVKCYSGCVLCMSLFIDRYIDTQADKKWILICRTPQIGALFSFLLSALFYLLRHLSSEDLKKKKKDLGIHLFWEFNSQNSSSEMKLAKWFASYCWHLTGTSFCIHTKSALKGQISKSFNTAGSCVDGAETKESFMTQSLARFWSFSKRCGHACMTIWICPYSLAV